MTGDVRKSRGLTLSQLGNPDPNQQYVIGPVLQVEGRENRWFVRNKRGIFGGFSFFWRNGQLVVENRTRMPRNSFLTEVTVGGNDVETIMRLDPYCFGKPWMRCYPSDERERREALTLRSSRFKQLDRRYARRKQQRRELKETGWVRAAAPDLFKALGLTLLAKHIWELRDLLIYLSEKKQGVVVKKIVGGIVYYAQSWLNEVAEEVRRYFELRKATGFRGDV